MDYQTGSKLSFTDEWGKTWIGIVELIFDDLSTFDLGLPNTKGFILAVGEVGSSYDVIGYDSQITEVLCK